MRVEHLRLFIARQSQLPWQRSNLWEGKEAPSPHFLQDLKYHPPERSENTHGRLKNPCRTHIHKRTTETETPKGPFRTSLRENKYTGSQGPILLRPVKQRLEIGAARGNQGSAQPRLAHKPAISTKQKRADPLIHIAPLLK